MRNQPTVSPLLAQALQLFRSGAYPQAISLLQRVVSEAPTRPEPRLQLAKACLDWVQVLARKTLTDIEPDALGDEAKHYLQLAESQLQVVEKSHPASPHVQSLLAMVHLLYGRPEDALRCLKKALAKDPQNPDVLYNMGYSLMELERYGEAATQFTRLTAMHPHHGMGWQMLGQARSSLGEAQAAVSAFQQAMKLLPGWFQPYGGLAFALRALKRYAEAKQILQAGLEGHADNRDLNFSLSNLSLATEDWLTGWRYYPCRSSSVLRLPFPEGHEIPLEPGRPVIVLNDQGLGDELFFLRFVPGMVARGMTVHYTTHPKLFPLLQGRDDIAELSVAEPSQGGKCDVLVGDLPYLTGMRSTVDIPPPLALPLDEAKVVALREQLSAFGPPPYLGVTWMGGTPKKPGSKGVWRLLHKEVPASQLGRLASGWPGSVVVMQRQPTPEALADFSKALGHPYLDWSHLNDDLSQMLAGLSLLNEYVGVSNTNMHLRAGIGKTARVLVPYPAEWRWMAEGDESPWFPGFRIYRQALDRSWDAALQRLKQDLHDMAEKG